MSITILEPINNSWVEVNTLIHMRGKVDNKDIIAINVIADDKYSIGSSNTIDGNWKLDCKFNTGGKRVINILGMNSDEEIVEKKELIIIINQSHMDSDYLIGIDVSNNNGNINWNKVASSGINFAFIKASEGGTFIDKYFKYNKEYAQKNNIPVGAYHFFKPQVNAEKQSELFLQTAGKCDLPAVLDIENSPFSQWNDYNLNQKITNIKKWIDIVKNETGKKPILYTAYSFWNDIMGNTAEFNDHHLWIANYTKNQSPLYPKKWTNWTFWQYTDKGKISGINGSVDLNRFKGSKEDLFKL